jgi:pimeloyl-ACP methyl ester carboxylesterase
MADVFISYARSEAEHANAAADALRAAGYSVWLDEDLPAHRPYAREIEAQLKAAKAALVVWSAEAARSEWVLSEANRAREDRKLIQVKVDRAQLPMPFDQIQCADLSGWKGATDHAGWRKVLVSLTELAGASAAAKPPSTAAAAIPPCPEVRYARSSDFDIAYMTLGQGPPDIVLAPGLWSHLEADWETEGRGGLLALSEAGRVITFDKRGQGMSDRMTDSPTLEERMDDIRAVMDAAGSERAVLWGASEAGPMVLLFAATYPERVVALVLWGSFARLDAEGETTVGDRLDAIARGWGTGISKDVVFGDLPDEVISRAACAHSERMSSTPGNVARQIELVKAIDVRATLPAIRAPTLILHQDADPLIPVARSRELASGIEGSRLVITRGHSHTALDNEGVMEAAIRDFLTSIEEPDDVEEQLATVLVCRGAEVVELAKANAERFRGRALAKPGAGRETVYVFDGPTRAVECALANRAVEPRLAQGVALGIVGFSADRVSGPATGQAAHMADAAAPGQVLMTRALRDVLAGARFRMEPAGDLYRVEL